MNKAITWAVILLVLATGLVAKYHPEIKWREITAGNYIVVFPLGYEQEATRTLVLAGEVSKELEEIWGPQPPGRIRIVLSDIYDTANGSATFFPYNQIELFLFIPSPDSTLSGYGEWLRLALTHELTHIFTMNAGSGFTYLMRSLMGSNPLFYPLSFYAPIWLQEGASVYAESRLNPGGRLNTPDYQLMLKNLGAAGKIPKAASLYGEPTLWPGPGAKYLLGAGFVDFLSHRFGKEKVKQLLGDFAYYLLPRTISSRFKKIFSQSLNQLWGEFTNSYASIPEPSYKMRQLTREGYEKKYPTFAAKGKVIYFNRNYEEFSGLWELDLGSGKEKELEKQTGVNAVNGQGHGNLLYYSALQYVKKFYRYSDLYVLDRSTGKSKRLTWGKRLSYPVALGQKIYCVQRRRARSYLAVYDLGDKTITPLSRGFQSISHPALSPDSQYMAVSLKRAGKNWDIGIFDLKGKLIEVLTDNGRKNFCPRWFNQESIYFISQRENNYRLVHFNRKSAKFSICEEQELPGLNHIEINRETGQLLVSYFDDNGYNLGLAKIKDLKFQAFEFAATPPETSKSDSQILGGKKYRWLRDLMPHYFTFNLREGGKEYQPGIYLSGSDALARHGFELEAYYGVNSNTLSAGFTYTYEGLVPSLVLSSGDFSDLLYHSSQGDIIRREKSVKLGVLFPLAKSDRHQAYLYSDIHAGKISHHNTYSGKRDNLVINGLKLGLLYNSAKQYYDSLSLADGTRFSLTYSRESAALGSDFDIHSLGLEYRQYLSLLRPNVLALRIAFADSWGQAWRSFPMGGNGSRSSLSVNQSGLFEIMRGFPGGFFSGRGGYLVNLEYRISLFKVERVFTVIQSIDRFYLSLFVDAGNTWYEVKEFDPILSLGVELNALVHVGGQGFNLCGGLALGRNPNHDVRFYFRLGHSF